MEAIQANEIKESNEKLFNDTKFTLGYMSLYLTTLYYSCEMIQWWKPPVMYTDYLQEKVSAFIHQIDRIWWDNFKAMARIMTVSDMVDSYYMTIWAGGIPNLWLDSTKFYDAIEEWTQKEYITDIMLKWNQ